MVSRIRGMLSWQVSARASHERRTHCVLFPRHGKRSCSLIPILSALCEDAQNVPCDVTRDILLHGDTGQRFCLLLLRTRRRCRRIWKG